MTELLKESIKDFFTDKNKPTTFNTTIQWIELRYFFYCFGYDFKEERTNESKKVLFTDRRAIIYDFGLLMNDFQNNFDGDAADICLKGQVLGELFCIFFSHGMPVHTDIESRIKFLSAKNVSLHNIIEKLKVVCTNSDQRTIGYTVNKIVTIDNLYSIALFLKTFILSKWSLESNEALVLANTLLSQLKRKLNEKPIEDIAFVRSMYNVYHGNQIYAMINLSDAYFVTGHDNGIIMVWDKSNGLCYKKLNILSREENNSITSLVALDDNFFISGSLCGKIKFWDLKRGKCFRILTTQSSILAMEVSFHLTNLITGHDNSTIKIWNTNYDSIGCSILSQNTSLSLEENVCLVNLHGGSRVLVLKKMTSELFASGHADGIKIWSILEAKCINFFLLDASVLTMSSITNTIIASGHSDGVLKIWSNTDQKFIVGAKVEFYHQEQGKWVLGKIEKVDRGSSFVIKYNDSYLGKENDFVVTENSIRFVNCNYSTFKTITTQSAVVSIISQNGRVFISGHEDNTFKIWSSEDYICIFSLSSHTGEEGYSIINSLVYLSDQHFASCHSDGTLKIWTFDHNSCTGSIMNDNAVTNVIQVSSEKLAASISSKDIKIFNIINKNCLRVLSSEGNSVQSLAFLKNDTIVVGYKDSLIKLWDVQDGSCLKQIYHDYSSALNCERIYISNLDKRTDQKEIIKTQTDEFCSESDGDVICVETISDGRFACGFTSNIIKIYNMKSGRCIAKCCFKKSRVTSLAELSDGRLVSGHSNGTIQLWNSRNGRSLNSLSFGKLCAVIHLTLLLDHDLAIGYSNGEINIWNTKSSKSLKCLRSDSHVTCIRALQGGNLVSSHKDGTIKFWNKEENRCSKIFYNQSEVLSLVVLRNNESLVSGESSGVIKFWDISGFKQISSVVRFHRDYI